MNGSVRSAPCVWNELLWPARDKAHYKVVHTHTYKIFPLPARDIKNTHTIIWRHPTAKLCNYSSRALPLLQPTRKFTTLQSSSALSPQIWHNIVVISVREVTAHLSVWRCQPFRRWPSRRASCCASRWCFPKCCYPGGGRMLPSGRRVRRISRLFFTGQVASAVHMVYILYIYTYIYMDEYLNLLDF